MEKISCSSPKYKNNINPYTTTATFITITLKYFFHNEWDLYECKLDFLLSFTHFTQNFNQYQYFTQSIFFHCNSACLYMIALHEFKMVSDLVVVQRIHILRVNYRWAKHPRKFIGDSRHLKTPVFWCFFLFRKTHLYE